MTVRRLWRWIFLLSAVILISPVPSPSQRNTRFPEFAFEIWGSAPRGISSLSEEDIAQKILFSIKEAGGRVCQVVEKPARHHSASMM